ncbi:MAG TPA: MarR family transcriptional regulator [Lacibacter sp.]|jgi:DNA-binding transcriptional regulator GbsR (MarR family)|nr:MarR family transcriptional regulator [Lacibacter sp.]
MKLSEARQQFISTWGAMGTHWGINRTMAQVHALLMISPDPLTQDDVMAQLNISRGNVNMNIRDLIDWGLVDRVLIQGERKEYFTAEKDIWKVARQIIKERKKRELDPMMKLMDQLSKVDGDKKDKEVKTFLDAINGIKKFGAHADNMLDVVVKSDENWFISTALKIFK